MPHGTWQTTGDGNGTLAVAAVIGAAILIGSGALTAAAAALASLLEVVLACVLAAVLIVTAAAVLIWRRLGHHPASVPEQIAASREARQARAAQRPAIAAPAQHLHFHFEGAAGPDTVPAVLKAIREGDREQ